MSINITSSLPRTILLGIRDNSGALEPIELESLPIHLPLMPLFTEWGPADDAKLVTGGAFNQIYGTGSLDFAKPFANHQSVFASDVMAQGNIILARRLLPAGADIARFRLSLDVVETELPEYERNPDGTYQRDVNGQLVETGDTVTGVLGRWTLQPIPVTADEYQFGLGTPQVGNLVSDQGAPSTLYPIFDFETRFHGSRGNNIGIRLAAPTMLSNTPIDGDVVDQMGAYIYRLWVVERGDAQSTATTIPTLQGEQYLPFTTKPGSVDRNTAMEYFLGDVGLSSWEETDPAQFSGYGRFGRIHTYTNHLEAVQDLIFAQEGLYDAVNLDATTPAQTINLLSAVHYTGVPYYSFRLQGAAQGGLVFTENTTHYAIGGADGDVSETNYDLMVREELRTFGEGQVPYMDSARYPFSCLYDSGFSIDTKRELPNVMRRKDVYVVVSTQDATRPLNTPSEDSSIAVALRTYLRSIPESEYYGTAACRAVVMAHAGKLVGSKYKGNVPFTHFLATRSAKYMGAGNGIMDSTQNFESAPGNVVREFRNHNYVFRSETARRRDWANGLTFAQSFDTQSIFIPGIQTIYDNETSILNTFMNMAIACNLTRIGERAWRLFVGNSQLPNSVLVAEVDRYITEQTTGRYNGRVDVTPRSYYTVADQRRGYSWTTDITMAGQSAKLVETLSIIAERRASEE